MEFMNGAGILWFQDKLSIVGYFVVLYAWKSRKLIALVIESYWKIWINYFVYQTSVETMHLIEIESMVISTIYLNGNIVN